MADHDDELADAVRELTETIDELRTELESSQRERRSPFRPPAPRPPTPRELLAFTDELAIPAAIAVLETSVRALEGFQRALRLARTEREARERTTEAARTAGNRAEELRRSTLSRLDTVLAELQRGASEGALPADEGARELLAEARELRDDVERRLREAGDSVAEDLAEEPADGPDTATARTEDVVRIDIEDGDPLEDESAEDDESMANPDPSVDVDAELETLREQYGSDNEDDPSDAATDRDGAASEPTDGDSDDGTDDGVATDDDDSPADENGSDGDQTGSNR